MTPLVARLHLVQRTIKVKQAMIILKFNFHKMNRKVQITLTYGTLNNDMCIYPVVG